MASNTPVTPVKRLSKGDTVKVSDGAGKEKDAVLADRIDVYNAEAGFDVEAISAAVEAGTILRDENTLVKVGEDYVVYEQLYATDLNTMQLLCAGPVDLVLGDDGLPKKGSPSVASAFNYGNDLNAKRAVRQAHEAKTKGPERTINSTVQGLIKLGFSKEEAETIAKSKLPAAPSA